MSESEAKPSTVINESISLARLHGEACFGCGSVASALYAAGTVTLAGRNRVWPIVTCGCLPDVTAAAGLPWLPPDGTVWTVGAGEHWDAVRVPYSLGRSAVEAMSDGCGAVISDSWSRILYFLTTVGTSDGWAVQGTVPCGVTTYVTVPPLNANNGGLHWLREPTAERVVTDPVKLRAALVASTAVILGPRTERPA
ncbi:hypothetical protein ACIQM0_04225 [Streptomyces sp. NPDC091387]|uniref:hypothetical protein n=1 Tax=Streptomyces sp. NPDC091387 TaxID=3365998 RepID=UPI00382D7929